MRRIYTIYFVIACLTHGLASGCYGVESQVSSEAKLSTIATVPMIVEANVPAIGLPVEFDGAQRTFVFDTGATSTILSARHKSRLGKRILWPYYVKGAEGTRAKAELYQAPEMHVGPIDLRKVISYVTAIDFEQSGASRFDGIIGMDILQHYVVDIDFDQVQVLFLKYVKEGESSLSSSSPVGNKWGTAIPLRLSWLKCSPYVRGTFSDGSSVEFLIDTGFVSNSAFGRLGDKTFEKIHSQAYAWGMDMGEHTVQGLYESTRRPNSAVLVESFSLGSSTYEDVALRRGQRSILGMGILCRYNVAFDFPNRKMYLRQRERQYAWAPSYEVRISPLGLIVFYKGQRTHILKVSPDGPAHAAGIQEGDVIINVDGHDVATWGLTKLLNYLTAPPVANEFSIILERGEDHITVHIHSIFDTRDGP